MTRDSGRRAGGEGGERERETEKGEGPGGGGRGRRRRGGGTPHVSPKTLGRPRCYARTCGPTNGHPNLLQGGGGGLKGVRTQREGSDRGR